MSTAADKSNDVEKEPFAEVDPSGRYGRYKELLGSGSVKKVFRGFDHKDGIEVAWNQVKLSNFTNDEKMIQRLFSEVGLLKSLKHGNILSSFSVWRDAKKNYLNFITEVCTSGSLRSFRKKHKHVSLKALKKWCMQILRGLNYMHSHDPCIIHRDLNCSNVFINGNTGKVKIGDLGMASITQNHSAKTLIGTPEFMAPEMYAGKYTESVDIYAFGMCVLELVTIEEPYSECATAVHVYKKVVAGVRPKAMEKVKDPKVKAFIEKCIAQPGDRPSAYQLIQDPFFDGLEEDSFGCDQVKQ